MWTTNKTTVYHHREQAAKMLGRPLYDGEVVHHKDEDRSNNDFDNLIVFKTQADHSRFHKGENTKLEELSDGSFVCFLIPYDLECMMCHEEFLSYDKDKMYCSSKCAKTALRKVERPSKEELQKLVWSKPTSVLARELGVSDVAISKWCKAYEIEKPPRGYWNKVHANKLQARIP